MDFALKTLTSTLGTQMIVCKRAHLMVASVAPRVTSLARDAHKVQRMPESKMPTESPLGYRQSCTPWDRAMKSPVNGCMSIIPDGIPLNQQLLVDYLRTIYVVLRFEVARQRCGGELHVADITLYVAVASFVPC